MSDVLGLDLKMREAYELLLQGNVSTAARMSERLRISRAQADHTVSELTAAGLVAASPDDPTQLVPLDPRRWLGPSIARRQAHLHAQQDELFRSQETFTALVAAYSSHDGSATGSRTTHHLSRSETAVRKRIEALLGSARESVTCVLAEGVRGIALGVSSRIIEHTLERGVSVRAVYADSILADDATRDHARWLASRGVDARSASSLPPAMLIVDRSIVLTPADRGTASAFVVHNRALAASLASLFDHVWERARITTPVSASPEGPSQQERDLLRLLGQGMTDASAARKLGVSLRTVRRMMAELMARLNARSRFEAGIRAAECGWVSRADSSVQSSGGPAAAPVVLNG